MHDYDLTDGWCHAHRAYCDWMTAGKAGRTARETIVDWFDRAIDHPAAGPAALLIVAAFVVYVLAHVAAAVAR